MAEKEKVYCDECVHFVKDSYYKDSYYCYLVVGDWSSRNSVVGLGARARNYRNNCGDFVAKGASNGPAK